MNQIMENVLIENTINVWNVIANNNLDVSRMKPYLCQQVSPLEEVIMTKNFGIKCTSWHCTADAPETRNQQHILYMFMSKALTVRKKNYSIYIEGLALSVAFLFMHFI